MQVASILFAAGFTYVTCLLAGRTVLRWLSIELFRSEENFFGFLLGAACLSTAVFALTAAGLARAGVFMATGAILIAVAVWRGAHRAGTAVAFPAMPRWWKAAFAVPYAIFSMVYVANALLPEASADGVAYHVGIISRYFRAHALSPITNNLFAGFPQGIEMLFLFAFAFGKHTAAAMVHLLFTLTIPFGMLSYGRRIGFPGAGVVGGLLFFLSPVIGKDGATAYVDVAAAAVAFGVFYLLQIWREQRKAELLVAIGMLCGFAYATKYTAALAVPYGLAYVVIVARRVRPVAIVGVFALAATAPWMAKDAIILRNPIAPLGNRLFPNPYMHVSTEKAYLQSVAGVPLHDAPLQLTLHGGMTGLLGPVFLLLPLILVSPHLLLAAVVFAVPFFSSSGTRYLIPCLPFVSLGMGLVIARWRAVAAVILILHAVLSWPAIVSRYADADTWRLPDHMQWGKALRLRPEADFLRRTLPDYAIGLAIDKFVPAGEVVFAFQQIQQAYHSHEIVVGWQSAFGERVQHIFRAPIASASRPTWLHDFRFPEKRVREIRLVQTATDARDQWSVAEVRVFSHGVELERAARWRLHASPNPWNVQFAFDGNPVTQWISGEPMRPGMTMQIDFGAEVSIDQVRVECSHDQGAMRMRLEPAISGDAVLSDVPAPPRLRRATIDAVKSMGVGWMVVLPNDLGAEDFVGRKAQWGITEMADENGYKLYRLD